MAVRSTNTLQERLAIACLLLLAGSFISPGIAQVPPISGWTLSTQFGPGWTTNPNDLPGTQKGDAYGSFQLGLNYRHVLREGTTLTAGISTLADWYLRESSAGSNRLAGSVSISQNWQGATFAVTMTARTSMDQPLRAHDEASQDISFSLSRPFALAQDWTMIPSLGAGRRFYQDGTKNDSRLRAGLVVARKWQAWTWRVGGNASYLLEDNTPILPRIRDRSWSVFVSTTYEWAKDRDIGLRLSYARAYSTYASNRYRSVSLAPQVSATFRF